MKYINTNKIEMTQKELDRINKYFEIDFEDFDENGDYAQEDLINELDAREDDEHPPIKLCFEFDNNREITVELFSGSSNYYDNNVLWEKDNERNCYYEIGDFDCTYEITPTMEFDYDDDTYICNITIKGEKDEQKI